MRVHQTSRMSSDRKDVASISGSEAALPDPPPIHPSFIQVAKPYIFEQTIQKCIATLGIDPLREESLRLQGVTWIDNVRRVLCLYVHSPLNHWQSLSREKVSQCV